MKKQFLLLVVFAMLLTACGGATKEAAPAIEISEPGKTIEVAAGSEFKIIIDSNPSTGYHWGLVGDLHAAMLEFVGNEYRASEPVMPGSGGKDVWTFKALAAGEATITLGYYPPSNEPVEPEQTVTFTVVVK